MKKALIVVMALFLAVSFTLVGCGPKKATSGTEAVEESKTLKTPEEQTKYLMSQAQAFIDSEQFQYAIDVLQYLLKYVDKDSPEAKDLLRKAQDALAVQMKRAAEEAAKQFGR